MTCWPQLWSQPGIGFNSMPQSVPFLVHLQQRINIKTVVLGEVLILHLLGLRAELGFCSCGPDLNLRQEHWRAASSLSGSSSDNAHKNEALLWVLPPQQACNLMIWNISVVISSALECNDSAWFQRSQPFFCSLCVRMFASCKTPVMVSLILSSFLFCF